MLSTSVSYTEQEKIEIRPQILPILFIACQYTALLIEPDNWKIAFSLKAVGALALKRQVEALFFAVCSLGQSLNKLKSQKRDGVEGKG